MVSEKALLKNLGWIFYIFGLAFIVAGLIWAFSTINFLMQGQTTTGVVVNFVSDYNTRYRRTMYTPIFVFVDANGKQHQVQSKVSRSSRHYEIGEEVPVRYLSSKPEDADIVSFFGNWGGPLIAGVLGIVSVFGGMFIFHEVGAHENEKRS